MRAVARRTEVTGGGSPSRGPRQTKVVVTQIQPWSIFKFSLLFYFCLMLVFLFAMLILYWVLSVIGVLDSLSNVLTTIGLGSRKTGFQFNGFYIFSRLFLFGVIGVIRVYT